MRRKVTIAVVLLATCRAPAGTAPPDSADERPAGADQAATSPPAQDGADTPWGAAPPSHWSSLETTDPATWGDPPTVSAAIRFARRGSVWLHPEGPAWNAGETTPFDPPATFARVDDPHGLRIMAEFGGVRMLLYASPEDLSMLVTRPTPVHAAPAREAPAGDARVELLPGAVVEVLDRRPPWVEVLHRSHGHEIHGWTPTEVIGVAYAPEDPPPLATGVRYLKVSAPATVVDRDGQSEVFTLTSSEESWWLLDQGSFGRLTRVRYEPPCNGRWRVEGYLRRPRRRRSGRAATPAPSSQPCPVDAPALWGEHENSDRMTVPAGTPLLERPNGQVVGITLRTVEFATEDGETLWIPSPWGPLPIAPATSES